MWRFIAGAQPPAKKVKRVAREDGEEGEGDPANISGEMPVPPPTSKPKPIRKFNQKWFLNQAGGKRTWLQYNEGAMFCSVCRSHAKEKSRGNAFVVGCKSMKIESVISHEQSACHRDCTAIFKAKSVPLEKAAPVQALIKLSDGNRQKMSLLFHNAHAIAKQARPYTDYVWMCT